MKRQLRENDSLIIAVVANVVRLTLTLSRSFSCFLLLCMRPSLFHVVRCVSVHKSTEIQEMAIAQKSSNETALLFIIFTDAHTRTRIRIHRGVKLLFALFIDTYLYFF